MSDARLFVQEVAPRDGLQIEPQFLPTEQKIRLVDACSAAGFSRIEVSSFVSPKAIPMLRDADEVFAGISRRAGTIYVALVPNLRGAERALIVRTGLFDVYEGAGLPEGQKSLGVEIALQPKERTLTDAEIEATCAKVVQAVAKLGGRLR